MILRVDRCPTGRRVFLLGRRVHHGACGVLAILAGGWAMWTDRRDWPWGL